MSDAATFGRQIAAFALVALADADDATSARELGARARRAIVAAALGLVATGEPPAAARAWAIAAAAAFDARLDAAIEPATRH